MARYPPAKSKRKAGMQSSDWVMQLIEEFSLFVGLSCDGFEGRLSALFADILASNVARERAPVRKWEKKV